MEEQKTLKEKIASFPHRPGVYLMRDAVRKIIYVGKANDLKSRILSYFAGKDTRMMAPFLMSKVRDIDFITTATPKEALILENNLIKRHRPRYNVTLRDDKTYYHLSLDPADPFPRLQLVRKRLDDQALYFGPYPSGVAAKETLRFVQQIFPLRSCRNRDFRLRSRPCLEHQIGRCRAPCIGLITEEAYRRMVGDVVSFLQGRRRELLSDLKKKMNEASENLQYEEAASLRDRIIALEHTLEKQHVDTGEDVHQDVLGLYTDGRHYQICLLMIREGKLLGSKSFMPLSTKAEREEVIAACLMQYYDDRTLIPDEIIVPCHPLEKAMIIEWLTEQKGQKVKLTVPVTGTKNALLDMAGENARNIWETANKKAREESNALRLIQEKLSLSRVPHHLECCDISNIGGRFAVGSIVVFREGRPDQKSYRCYRIRMLSEPDDYAMMREMLTRRFSHTDSLPDLLVVDGGKGQLNVALSVLREMHLKLDVIGLAKQGKGENPKMPWGKRAIQGGDRIYLPGRKDAVCLSPWPQAMHVLQQARDEAHRFALSHYRRLKQKDDLSSVLDEIPDIGEKRKMKLLSCFGSVEKIREASVSELQKVPGMGRSTAEKIYRYLKKPEGQRV